MDILKILKTVLSIGFSIWDRVPADTKAYLVTSASVAAREWIISGLKDDEGEGHGGGPVSRGLQEEVSSAIAAEKGGGHG